MPDDLNSTPLEEQAGPAPEVVKPMAQEAVQLPALPPLVRPPEPQAITEPQAVEETYEEIPAPEAPAQPMDDGTEDVSDITSLDEQDIHRLFSTDGLTATGVDENDDFSDLLDVTDADVMGDEPKPKTIRRIRRTGRRYLPPQTMGGVQY